MEIRDLQHIDEFDIIFNVITEPVFIYDKKGIVIKVNHTCIDDLGFNPVGKENSTLVRKLFPQAKKPVINDLISQRVLKGETIRDYNCSIKTSSGQEKIFNCSAAPITKQGDIVGAICIWNNVTQEKNRESLLNQDRQRLLNILDSIQDGIYICNKDYSVEYANPVLKKRLGSPQGKKCYEYLYKRKKKCPWCKNPAVFTGKSFRSEWYDPDSGRTYDLIDTPLYNPDGSISKLKIFHDITESKKREKSLKRDKHVLQQEVNDINLELAKKATDLEDKKSQLKKQSEIIERLFANTHFLIALLDTDFNFIRVNKAYADADGKAVDYFIGKNHFDLYPHAENQAIFHKVLQTGRPYITYARAFTYPQNPERGITYWDWSLNPIKDEKGVITGLILILLDVTARKKAEMELAAARRLSDIGALATTVAHELRSPLGVIQGTVYNVKKKYNDKKIIKNMQRIEKKVGESEKIINNLLNYSRIKQPDLKKIHLYNFLNECVNDIKRQYNNSKIQVNQNYESFKDIILQLDPFQMREVFLNVFNNAYQAVPDDEGIIHIDGHLEPDFLYIDIGDNGPGIEREDLAKIFEPFFTRKSKGTGLGLTICRELVNLHKGMIEINSEKGGGTLVRIILPLNIKEK